MFPSLTGVIRFLIKTVENTLIVTVLFPSLTGVIRFLILGVSDEITSHILKVSVPYRGYSFFN